MYNTKIHQQTAKTSYKQHDWDSERAAHKCTHKHTHKRAHMIAQKVMKFDYEQKKRIYKNQIQIKLFINFPFDWATTI